MMTLSSTVVVFLAGLLALSLVALITLPHIVLGLLLWCAAASKWEYVKAVLLPVLTFLATIATGMILFGQL